MEISTDKTRELKLLEAPVKLSRKGGRDVEKSAYTNVHHIPPYVPRVPPNRFLGIEAESVSGCNVRSMEPCGSHQDQDQDMRARFASTQRADDGYPVLLEELLLHLALVGTWERLVVDR